jgi:hypothetical protein
MEISSTFWSSPEAALVHLSFADSDLGMLGMTRNGLALLHFMPPADTGYHYLDVVTVEGPMGTTQFKDDPVDIYRVTGLYRQSGNNTYRFEIQLASMDEYNELLARFQVAGQCFSLDTNGTFDAGQWLKGICSARYLHEAAAILQGTINGQRTLLQRLMSQRKKPFPYRALAKCD